jgi:hypothetical protein
MIVDRHGWSLFNFLVSFFAGLLLVVLWSLL